MNFATIYRFIRDQGLNQRQVDPNDRRRYEADHPNAIWQCDVMHGPSVRHEEKGFRKTYLFAIIDDHSRLIVHAEFYWYETFLSLKECLKKAVSSIN
ncbi:DDE-type integrase/transposase/recombinase [Pseudobacteriovorax antillogorgiicola]|uniref:Integrase core domain-containing protein n=1 Tax=Pseudobacteriovorax antillogorgiicola TaxID=1513793 RepID=A0A1Y6CLP0_9BACT|nr:DDE-type integrase/transposase/recombinase [Pseudobacteriovorax antillogorgiicola]TCS45245.1 integrase-like protein [Pseudobacteriovorax antillogorgiicola]SMF75230.1 Integrase core domain-containing protein [Pseudobacteriovorax antillogorgiicola]